MNDKAWNVHHTNTDRLQDLLNDHAAKGYRLHSWIRDGSSLCVIFRNEHVEEMMVHAGRLIDYPAVAEERYRIALRIAAASKATVPSPQPVASPSQPPAALSPLQAASEQPHTAHEDFLVGASDR